MASALKRIHSSTGAIALVVALLALLASAAGVGYAAGQIGTDDIQDNAVTAKKIDKNAVTSKKIKKNAVTGKKIKDGSLKPADWSPQEAQHRPVLGNGGEGDCAWQSGESQIPGLAAPSYRLDRDGRVIIGGVAVSPNGTGGDAVCDPNQPGQASDGIIFTLPTGYIPARTQFLPGIGGLLLVVGPQGYAFNGMTLPAGSVFALDNVILDGVEFDPAGSRVVIAKVKASGQWTGDPLG